MPKEHTTPTLLMKWLLDSKKKPSLIEPQERPTITHIQLSIIQLKQPQMLKTKTLIKTTNKLFR
jgi:hypothetical protein